MAQRVNREYLENPGWFGESSEYDDDGARIDVSDDAIVIDLRDGVTDPTQEQAPPSPTQEYAPPALDDRNGLLAAPTWALFWKRFMDVAAAMTLILLLLPLMLTTAIAVKATSRGPMLYMQDRVGKGGAIFRFAKFRSMRDGADRDKRSVEHLNEVDGPVFKIKNDPRVTRVGAFIRKFSIDELPQLFHVLSGQMSLVGPRPPLPDEVAEYDVWHHQRLLVKPGLTCIWQVSGRSEVDFDTWVEMDLEYIANWSPWLDLKILALTVPAVLTGRGAY